MAVIKVNKTENYTVMSNVHLQEKNMSLKAKGLLSLMLSLPEEWDYSIDGLCAICKENISAIKSTLTELKEFGYLVIEKQMPDQTATGRIEYIYNIYEQPQTLKQESENQPLEKQEVEKQEVENQPLEILPLENQSLEIQPLEILEIENQRQLNIYNKINKNKLNKINKQKKEKQKEKNPACKKHKFGQYQNVLLTEEDIGKLKGEYPQDWEERIERLSEYMASTGKPYKNHLATIRAWARRDTDAEGKAAFGSFKLAQTKTDQPRAKPSYDIDKLKTLGLHIPNAAGG